MDFLERENPFVELFAKALKRYSSVVCGHELLLSIELLFFDWLVVVVQSVELYNIKDAEIYNKKKQAVLNELVVLQVHEVVEEGNDFI